MSGPGEGQVSKAPGHDPEFPDLNGPHWQPNWGPNGEGFCIAIMTPGRILTKEEQAEFDLMNEELANAEQIIAPADDDEAKEGPPHRDPVGTAKTPQKLGNTATGWEAWIDEDHRTYYYYRAMKITKYNWTLAEIEDDEQRFARLNPHEKDDTIVPH